MLTCNGLLNELSFNFQYRKHYSYNPHKSKFSGVLSNCGEYKGVLRPKRLKTATLTHFTLEEHSCRVHIAISPIFGKPERGDLRSQ